MTIIVTQLFQKSTRLDKVFLRIMLSFVNFYYFSLLLNLEKNKMTIKANLTIIKNNETLKVSLSGLSGSDIKAAEEMFTSFSVKTASDSPSIKVPSTSVEPLSTASVDADSKASSIKKPFLKKKAEKTQDPAIKVPSTSVEPLSTASVDVPYHPTLSKHPEIVKDPAKAGWYGVEDEIAKLKASSPTKDPLSTGSFPVKYTPPSSTEKLVIDKPLSGPPPGMKKPQSVLDILSEQECSQDSQDVPQELADIGVTKEELDFFEKNPFNAPPRGASRDEVDIFAKKQSAVRNYLGITYADQVLFNP